MGKKKGGIPGVSFSWKRASGLSSAKQKLSRQIGIPLTRAGRQRKAGKAMGCAFATVFLSASFFAAGTGLFRAVRSLLA